MRCDRLRQVLSSYWDDLREIRPTWENSYLTRTPELPRSPFSEKLSMGDQVPVWSCASPAMIRSLSRPIRKLLELYSTTTTDDVSQEFLGDIISDLNLMTSTLPNRCRVITAFSPSVAPGNSLQQHISSASPGPFLNSGQAGYLFRASQLRISSRTL